MANGIMRPVGIRLPTRAGREHGDRHARRSVYLPPFMAFACRSADGSVFIAARIGPTL
jgi:hypothetical protein